MLKDLGIKHGTDKGEHTFQGRSYLDIYDEYFKGKRAEVRKVVEIGVFRGSSLRMWKEYFYNATIYGIDNQPECANVAQDNIVVFVESQNDPRISLLVPDALDFVLDDGSHVVNLTLRSFELLFPKLKSGGLYAIEDLNYSYHELWPPMVQAFPELGLNNSRDLLNSFLLKAIQDLDKGVGSIKSIHFYHELCLIEKV